MVGVIKSEKMAKRYTFGGVVRKSLSDITNSASQQTKIPNLEKTLMPLDHSLKEYLDHLVKENMALARLVADKNKIIELTGTELQKMQLDLQKMRFDLQKMQLQNLNLAQTNSHMLAEINIGKDKRKALQHENNCKDALLKVKNEELKKANMKIENCDNCQKKLTGGDVMDKHIPPVNANAQKTRRVAARSKSMCPTSQPVAEKEVSENKRRCLRRQSATLRTQEQEPAEDLFETEEAQFLSCPSVDFTPHKLSSNSFTRKEEKNENCGRKFDGFQSRRSSLCRPSRRAADKVQSYKELPLNAKMRR